MAEVVLGVAGGIAAYKSCELLRLFTEAGHQVQVVPTEAALRFVGAPTWEALSGRPVADDVWSRAYEVPHVRIGRRAELVVVAPATADLLAKAATGLADDLLTNTLLTAAAPVLYAPAMHTEMWEHPATVANVATLRSRGAVVVEPAVGRLTGADTGKGRLPEPETLFALAERLLHRGSSEPDLAGRRVVVTAGGTREPLDPVRFLGNRSSGKQGLAFARTAAARGARVRLIAANVEAPAPAGVDLVTVVTTAQLREATLEASADADAVVMAAAPCDFTPAQYTDQKLAKQHLDDGVAGLTLSLVATPDIAAELGAGKSAGTVLVTFAAETVGGAEAEVNARAKLARKGADLIVLNQVGGAAGRPEVFGSDRNAATVFGLDGTATVLSEQSKDELADAVWDLVKPRLKPT
ncbi:bifunctional phosphopantothenoylcysteine decarboxylase/phosphopantothenate--cysteine ligase CoaBC [Natronosporangium hydrolyticum]|uniref:Coenzyme A biosynthesis bifunctional protein CoaBC n=1 Tax=Natronosporangium hydrolyticum TaxID=2811111 RepID=A0A895YGN1_9ACTN|nr:bifunctional phosphopantothenoylcysteine decarboxylase/phosphopantothenate--cysteine ligase CoaBC [Natronosporangium hydrolyticum]QSB16977.1 bifunctional phosphopantothenoylcysteine decarboxylase/phosphopantothenate--cysteine ligase CoaBC [Natronosporangium hydrolyticum]